MSRNVPIERLEGIATEVMDLMGVADVFEFLDSQVGDGGALDARLREVMMSRYAYECIELAMYLRTSYSRQAVLPTWQPLLNAAIELAMMRNEPVFDIFYGLMPHGAEPQRNTGQPVYKPNQT